jgi:hypothetical protein
LSARYHHGSLAGQGFPQMANKASPNSSKEADGRCFHRTIIYDTWYCSGLYVSKIPPQHKKTLGDQIKSLLAAANSAISCNQIMLQYTWFMANSQLQTSIPTCLFIHLSTDHALHPIKTFHKELTAFQMELRKTSVAVVFWTISQKNCSIVIGRTVLPTGFLPK